MKERKKKKKGEKRKRMVAAMRYEAGIGRLAGRLEGMNYVRTFAWFLISFVNPKTLGKWGAPRGE